LTLSLAALTSTVFKTVGAAVPGTLRTVTYLQTGTQTYNPATGAVSNSTQYFTVQAILTEFKQESKTLDFQDRRQQAVEAGDQKCLIPYQSLPIVPALVDMLTIGSDTWRIVDFKTDPTGTALHTLHIRRS
jgi:hypothetical protein